MGTSTWESHLSSRGNSAVEGTWDNGTPWSFYNYDQVLPDASELPILTSMCVPVFTLNVYNPRVILTLNMGRGGWEIPGGHGEQNESAAMAAIRETEEETGMLVTNEMIPFGYVEAKNAPGTDYPALTYMQLFGAYTLDDPELMPSLITDPEVDGAGIFTWDTLRRMAERGAMKFTELQLVRPGVRAVLRHYGLSDEHITLP